jgi:threonine/homoserine/homoserine lactone efflux protein
MFAILAKIIPLDFAATLSPGIFALAIVLLGNQFHPKSRTWALFFGTLMVGLGVGLLGFILGHAATSNIKQNLTFALIDIVLGLVFIFLGLRTIFAKERKIKTGEDERPKILKWILIGFIISVTNFDALFFSFAAAKEVGASEISDILKLIFLIVNLIFFTLPILLPLIFYSVAPNLAQSFLNKINQFVIKYSKYIIFLIFIIFGIIFVYRGIKFFI